MFSTQITKYYTSYEGSDRLQQVDYTNNLVKFIEDKFPIKQAVFIPEKYDVAFLLVEESVESIEDDKWKAVFYKKILKIPDVIAGGTITLDNADVINNNSANYTYEVYKEIDGSLVDMIKISIDLINKHGNI